jgi:DNA-binding response OmpR family regulator
MTNDQRPRVLIVEDEPDMNSLLAEILTAYGYEPVRASDVEEALASIARQAPDALLLDLMLPGRSGLELCRQLKTSRETRCIPIVICTALDRPVDRRHGYEAGADDYVTKPFTPEGLVARLAACLAAPAGSDHLVLAMDLAASLADLKSVNLLVTHLYGRTDLPPRDIEALRAGLVALADAADRWAASHRGAAPVRLTADFDGQRLELRFHPIAEGGEAFLAEQLDPESPVPAGFTDAGLIDRIRREGGDVVLEKAVPPRTA